MFGGLLVFDRGTSFNPFLQQRQNFGVEQKFHRAMGAGGPAIVCAPHMPYRNLLRRDARTHLDLLVMPGISFGPVACHGRFPCFRANSKDAADFATLAGHLCAHNHRENLKLRTGRCPQTWGPERCGGKGGDGKVGEAKVGRPRWGAENGEGKVGSEGGEGKDNS